jgi:methionine synthase I (cobalamin-dependent)
MLDRRLDATNVVLDGDLATVLYAADVPPGTPVEDWVRDRPADVRLAHEAFIAVGAQILTAATYRSLAHLRADWAELVDRALAVAKLAAGDASVYAAIGPSSVLARRWLDASYDERTTLTSSWALLARRCAAAGADGFAIEGFADPNECVVAVTEVRAAAPELTIAASLSPRDDGKLFDGSEPADALLALRQAGANWAGFTGGTGPTSIEAAVSRAPDADWARPSSGGLGLGPIAEALVRLGGRCHRVGGWSGVDPAMIAELRRVSAHGFPVPRNSADVGERV